MKTLNVIFRRVFLNQYKLKGKFTILIHYAIKRKCIDEKVAKFKEMTKLLSFII